MTARYCGDVKCEEYYRVEIETINEYRRMTEFAYTLFGAIVSIIVTWIFNQVTARRQHKREMQRIAVQNKLETSKSAMGWLTEVKSELSIIIWALEHKDKIAPEMIGGVVERANRLNVLELDARKQFNAIELYYKFDEIKNKYNLGTMIPQFLTLQNVLAELTSRTQVDSVDELEAVTEKSLLLLKNFHSAVSDIIEMIREDNLCYLQNEH